MIKASMILGKISGIIIILISAVFLIFTISFSSGLYTIDDEGNIEQNIADRYMLEGVEAIVLLAGIMSLAGGAMAKKRNILSGILMITGGGIVIFVVWAFIPIIVFYFIGLMSIAGGILAFMEKKP